MRAVVQRVRRARVILEGGAIAGEIGAGLCVMVGVAEDDDDHDAHLLAAKVAGLRIFADDAGLMNRSLADVGGSALVVSQFTLLGDARRGRRPSFARAAGAPQAEALYERVAADLRELGLPVETGIFGAAMQVELVNDGPVTILLDTKQAF